MKKNIKKLQFKKRTVSALNHEKQQRAIGGATGSRPMFTCNGSCVGTCFCPSPPVTETCTAPRD